jgi:hypothetical protein
LNWIIIIIIIIIIMSQPRIRYIMNNTKIDHLKTYLKLDF